MKRHNFRGFGDGHGVERKHRTSGSIGNRTTPGRVFKGKRMSGRMGIDTVTMQNLTIHSVDADKNVILVKGSIPGINGSQVVIRTAAKSVASEVLNKAGA
jgi:large subunit ribosomal protein L3